MNKEITLYAVCIRDDKKTELEKGDEMSITYINDIPHYGDIKLNDSKFRLVSEGSLDKDLLKNYSDEDLIYLRKKFEGKL